MIHNRGLNVWVVEIKMFGEVARSLCKGKLGCPSVWVVIGGVSVVGGVVSGSRLEDCPQALAWSPR